MIKFHKGINRYYLQESSDEIINNLVINLNDKFGDYECKIHTHPEWLIGVDLLKTGIIQFSSMKDNGCNFPSTLNNELLTPYLKSLNLFPLRTE